MASPYTRTFPTNHNTNYRDKAVARKGGGLVASPEVNEDIYLGFCRRDSPGSVGRLVLRADRGLSRQLLCPHGQYGRGAVRAGMGQRHHSLFLPPCVGAVYRQRGGLRL